MDSGGITGRMRTDSEGREIAYCDGLRTLLSLIEPKSLRKPKIHALKDLLRKRNSRGQDLGYTIFSHYYDQQNGFNNIQSLIETLTDMKFPGRIIPSTLSSTHIDFRTQSGNTFHEEHELDNQRMSTDMIQDIWLDPPTKACPEAVATIKDANYIFFSCGSLYGSILANLLPRGMKNAIRKTKAKKILITNLASTRNTTHDFTPLHFIKVLQKYTGLTKPLDAMIIPNVSRQNFENKYSEVAKRYATEHSYFLGWEKELLHIIQRETKIEFHTHKATVIDPIKKRIRHDPKKLSTTLRMILREKT